MAKKKLPDTSIEARERATPEMITDHQKKILYALKVIGPATYDVVAEGIGLDRHQVGRRLKELEEKKLVFKPGTKGVTRKGGRKAYHYAIIGETRLPKDVVSESSMPGKTVAAYSRELIQTKMF